MKKSVLLILILVFASKTIAMDICKPHLFYIAKSDNTNVLYYDANLEDGKFNPKNPVNIYWIKHADKGQQRGLTILQRPHFGLVSKELESGEKYRLNIRQSRLSYKDMTLFFKDGCPEIAVSIDGVQSYLENVFIQINPDSGTLPEVQYIDINGVSIDAPHKAVTKRIMAKKPSREAE